METLDEEIGFKYAQFIYSIKTVSCEGLAKKKKKIVKAIYSTQDN